MELSSACRSGSWLHGLQDQGMTMPTLSPKASSLNSIQPWKSRWTVAYCSGSSSVSKIVQGHFQIVARRDEEGNQKIVNVLRIVGGDTWARDFRRCCSVRFFSKVVLLSGVGRVFTSRVTWSGGLCVLSLRGVTIVRFC